MTYTSSTQILCTLYSSALSSAGENRYMDMVNSIASGQIYYKALEVDRDATAQEIKKAYRRLALK